MRLEGDIAVVSGGAGGIGAAVCRQFAAEGARVASLDLVASPDAGLSVICDLTDDASVAAAAKTVRTTWGAPSVVVHAAAITELASTLDSSPAAFARVYDINVGGGLRLAQAFAPAMRQARRGALVFVSSINGGVATPGQAAYAASKGGLNTFMKTLALELAPEGVRVNSVAPASVDTPLLRASFARTPDPEAALAANVLRHPLGRLGTADDVARLILFLASSEASWITGGVFPIDGGASLTRR